MKNLLAMSCNLPVLLCAVTCRLLVVCAVFNAVPSHAQLPEFSVSATQVGLGESFTVTHRLAFLNEQEPDGTWQELYGFDTSTTFTKTIPGEYHYRTRVRCGRGCLSYSDTITVHVLPGPAIPLDSLEIQQQYQADVRLGDINSDGRKDIYIERLSGNANNGVISVTLLQQLEDARFVVLDATSHQLATASSWPLAAIEAIWDDFSLDGFADLYLREVGALISGVEDQLVFSSGTQYKGTAETATAIDDNVKKTFGTVANWILDTNYLQKNILTGTRVVWQWVYRCTYWGECGWRIFPVMVRYSYYDPEKITQDGVTLVNLLNYCITHETGVMSASTAGQIRTVLGRTLGIGVEGAKMSAWGKILTLASAIHEIIENRPDYIKHYTTRDGQNLIPPSNHVLQSDDGHAYFTRDNYVKSEDAKDKLALYYSPVGYFMFDKNTITPGNFSSTETGRKKQIWWWWR